MEKNFNHKNALSFAVDKVGEDIMGEFDVSLRTTWRFNILPVPHPHGEATIAPIVPLREAA
jgi:hypothetical protein